MCSLCHSRWHTDFKSTLLYKIDAFSLITVFVKCLTILKLNWFCEEEKFFKLVLGHVSEDSKLRQYSCFGLDVLLDRFVDDPGVVNIANTQ
jgi:hypothetical protein